MDYKNYLQALINSNLETAKEIRKKNNVGSSSEEAYGFIVAGLKIIYPGITNNELIESITDNDNDEQIDAIVIKDNYVDIYDFKKSEGFGEGDIRLFKDSVDKFIFKSIIDTSRCDELIRKRIEKTKKAIEDDNYNVRLRVVRGGGNSNYTQGQDALNELTYNSIVEKSLISLKDLVDSELKLNISPLKYDWNITVKTNSTIEDATKIKILEGSKITSLICRLSLKEVVNLYHLFQPNPEKIFEANVRGLQNNKKISSQILSSLSNTNKAKSFYKLHNGLTIVCDDISERNHSKYIISNPQIVNGCQTVTTISNHFKSNRDSNILNYGSVICKIFAAGKTEVENICLASNSQVAINAADLRTNDNIQLIIESYLNKNGVKYDRKAIRVSKNNYLTFKDLGQWLCSTIIFKPAFSKNSKSKIFTNEGGVYHEIFDENINLEEVLKIVNFGIYIRDKISAIPNKQRTYEIPANLHFLAALYYLNKEGKKWTNDFSYSRINSIIKQVISEIKVKKGEDISYPIIFTKNEDTWKEIKKKIDIKILNKNTKLSSRVK